MQNSNGKQKRSHMGIVVYLDQARVVSSNNDGLFSRRRIADVRGKYRHSHSRRVACPCDDVTFA